jgi:hypothetical protein
MPANEFGFTAPLFLAPGNIDYLPLGNYYPEPQYEYSSGVTRPHRLLYDSRFVSYSIPASTSAGASIPVSVTVNNTGSGGWIGPYVGFAAHNDAAKQFNPVRVSLDDGEYVGPDHVETLTFDLRVPDIRQIQDIDRIIVSAIDPLKPSAAIVAEFREHIYIERSPGIQMRNMSALPVGEITEEVKEKMFNRQEIIKIR